MGVDPDDAARLAGGCAQPSERAERDRVVAAQHERQRPSETTSPTSVASAAHASRISGRKRARSSRTASASGSGTTRLPRSTTRQPNDVSRSSRPA